MWRDLELRELRIFLVLADELHFGRTAERLGISQPGVSEAVRVLESRLGVKVFDRTSRRVRLTPAGEALRGDLVPALAALDQALAQTSELARTVRGLLRGGFVLTADGPAFSQLTTEFQARYPACEVRLQEVVTFDAYRALRRGDIDVLCNWLAVDEPGLTAGSAFAWFDRALAVAPGHRLATRPVVSVEDLADEEGAQVPPAGPARRVRPAGAAADTVRAGDPPHSAGADDQRDPGPGRPRPHRPPDQLHRPHLQPERHRPGPDRGPAAVAAGPGLEHPPGQPAHPRPQRHRPLHGCGQLSQHGQDCCRLEKLMLLRGPAGVFCLGTLCRQSRWQRPPITIRSPLAGLNTVLAPPASGRIRNRRVAPRLSTGTIAVSGRLAGRSACQPVPSRWSR